MTLTFCACSSCVCLRLAFGGPWGRLCSGCLVGPHTFTAQTSARRA